MEAFLGIGPIAWLTLGGMVLLIMGTFARGRAAVPVLGAAWATVGMLLGVYLAWAYPEPRSSFFGMLWGGGLYALLAAGVSGVGALGLAFLRRALPTSLDGWEAFPLTLLLLAALASLSSANHLLLSVVALETVSLGAYVLVALSWADRYAPEAAVKYFLLSAVGFAFLLFGLSYLYGLTGTLYLHHLRPMRWGAWATHPLFALAMGMIGIGLLFKLSVFPFHWWAPDVYGGATPGGAGLVVALGKLSAAFLGGQLLHAIEVPGPWLGGVAGLAAVSSLLGNLLALRQSSLQRMLGYSSVAHGGYILLALLSGPEGRLQAWAYALVYGFTSVLTFGLLSLRNDPLEYKSLRGLGYAEPGYAIALAASLASLSGLPPLIGFFAKYGVFVAAFRTGYLLPGIVALLGALIGYFAYWRPISWLYQPGEALTVQRRGLAIGTILLLVFGVAPALLWGWMDYLYGVAGFFLPRP